MRDVHYTECPIRISCDLGDTAFLRDHDDSPVFADVTHPLSVAVPEFLDINHLLSRELIIITSKSQIVPKR